MRIFHCPTSVGGNPQGISSAEKKIGLESYNLVLYSNYLEYNVDEILFQASEGRISKIFKKTKVLANLVLNYDVVHYNSGVTLFPLRLFISKNIKNKRIRKLFNHFVEPFIFFDMKVLKLLGKKIYVTFQGSDARLYSELDKYFDYNVLCELPEDHVSELLDSYKKKNIKIFNKYANKIFSVNPDLLNFLPSRTVFIGYSHVYGLNKCEVRENPRLLIVHAPTNKEMKGTKYILKAIQVLKEKYDFDFKLIENMSNVEALNWYKKADLLIDQLFLGWYGGVAVEAMSFGTPVMAYIREDDLKFIPLKMKEEIPIINVNKFTIENVLEEVLLDPRRLEQLNQASIEYVKKWHDPVRNAKIINGYKEYSRGED